MKTLCWHWFEKAISNIIIDCCRFVEERSTYHLSSPCSSSPTKHIIHHIYKWIISIISKLINHQHNLQLMAMASSATNDSSSSPEMEGDDELFEIDLEAVNTIPPPHYCESKFTSTATTLLANCLLPISDVSSAIPVPNLLVIADSLPILPANVVGIPFMGAFGIEQRKPMWVHNLFLKFNHWHQCSSYLLPF